MIIKYKFYTPKHELVEQDLTAFATIDGAENQKAKILEILDRDGKKVVQDILKIKKIDLDYRGLYFHPKLKIMALIRIPQNGTIDDYKNYIFRLDKDISEKVVQEIVDKATKNFVNKTELANYSLKTDLTDYAKKSDITNFALKSEIPSLDDYAKKSEIPTLDNVALKSDLNDLAKKSEIPDVSNFVNKTELTEYAKNTELSKYALKTDVPTLDDYAKKTDLANYTLKSELANYTLKTDLVDYAKKTDIPALDDYAKKSEIPALDDYAKKTDLNDLAKKSDIASVYRVKGNADNLDNITEKQVGDVYNFTDGANYVWTGTEWDKLSETIDLSEYAKKSEIPGFKGETSDLKAVQSTSKKGDIYKLTSDNALYIFDGTNFLKFADFESEGNGVDI